MSPSTIGLSANREKRPLPNNDRDSSLILRRALYHLRSSTVRTYPYPHFYGAGAFDETTLSEMHQFWPSAGQLKSIATTSRVSRGRYEERNIISIESLAKTLPENGAAYNFWSSIGAAMGSDEFVCELLEWLWPDIKRTRDLPETISIFPDLILTEDSVGYAIGPHTDSPNRLVTILFYVPENEGSVDTGTSIYVPKASSAISGMSAIHRRHDEFYNVFTAPFSPNSFFGFVVGPNSYHGVEPIKTLTTSRRQIQLSIRFK